MDGSVEILVPELGDVDDVLVSEVLVAQGDRIEKDQSLVALESDKASMEIPAPAAGTLVQFSLSVGDRVAQGSVIGRLQPDENAAPSASDTAPPADSPSPPDEAPAPGPPAAATPPEPPVRSTTAAAATTAADSPVYASPSVRKYARERGVDLRGLRGSGRKGRIVRADVDAAKAAPTSESAPAGALPPMPVIDFARFGEVETVALTRINRLTGQSVHRSWLHVPHVTQFDSADITDLEAFRRERKAAAEAAGVKLTFVSFVLAAVAAALREFPKLNASLDASGESLILKKYIHLGVAVDTPKGLVVPVVRDVDQKRIFEIAHDLSDLSTRARDGKLTPTDIQGGTFTVSSLGGVGGTAFTPIVNAPEVAILGVSRSRMEPVWDGETFVPRLMLPLSLSYDHRVVDGAEAARFTTYLARVLGDIRDLLL